MRSRSQTEPVRIWTLMAIGVLAYVGSMLLHEVVGHGGLCILTGGHVTLLNPLGMRCSVIAPAMVAAGPLANLIGGLLCAVALRNLARLSGNTRYFLWFSMMFNLLIAAGYMAVCGIMDFGDWAVLIGGLEPRGVWRALLVVAAIVLYYWFFRMLAVEYYRLSGSAGFETPRLRRVVGFPIFATAVVACAAAAFSPTDRVLALELSFATTVVVGLSLLSLPDALRRAKHRPDAAPAVLSPSAGWIGCGVIVAALFVLVLGPGI